MFALFCAIAVAAGLSLVQRARAADQPIDLDGNPANGQESKITTKVLQTYPVEIENTIYNNALGSSYTFDWSGAGPGGFSSYVTAGPGVGTKWVWSTVYQVYSIQSPAQFTPSRSLTVFGSSSQGVQTPSSSGGSFMVPGKSIYPTDVTLSDASLTASLITFFSPEKTVASCGVQCAPGQCDVSFTNLLGGTVTMKAKQLECCSEAHQTFCDGQCTSYLTDPNNCGACGNVCASDEFCSDGTCVCDAGLTQCDAGCVDAQTDPNNCGACGNACASDEFCSGGACVCDTGLTQCGAGCVDTQTDPDNCGTCGTVCPIGGSCDGGACACPVGQVDCGGTCVDLQSDPLNCGTCGNACGSNDICSAGTCQTCRPPLGTACDNECVNTHTDPYNCGACGYVCDFSNCPSTGTGTCSQGSSCVCDPAPTLTTATTGLSSERPVRFDPVYQPSLASGGVTTSLSRPSVRAERGQERRLLRSAARRWGSTTTAPSAGSGDTTASTRVATPTVVEAPVCVLDPIEQVIPSGGTYTQTETGGRFGKEIQTSVAITVNGQTIAQGPCPLIVPVTDVDTSGVILSPRSVAIKDTSGDGLCQPGEARCEYFITVSNLGDTACVDPVATLTSPPDQFDPNPITFLNGTSSYPSLPAYPGDGVPVEKETNTTAFAITTLPTQLPDVGRPYVMDVTCANLPTPVVMPITLGIGSVCDPTDLDGKTYDQLLGFQAPVKAQLVPAGTPINFSTGNFNDGSTIPLKLSLGCGGVILSDVDINPKPKIVSLVHTVLGPQSLLGINGDNNANPDNPAFSCSSSSCDFQFRTAQLPLGTYIIGVQMPDTRIFRAGFTISP